MNGIQMYHFLFIIIWNLIKLYIITKHYADQCIFAHLKISTDIHKQSKVAIFKSAFIIYLKVDLHSVLNVINHDVPAIEWSIYVLEVRKCRKKYGFFLLQYFRYKIIIEVIPPQRPSEVCHHLGCQGLPGSDRNIDFDYLTFFAY